MDKCSFTCEFLMTENHANWAQFGLTTESCPTRFNFVSSRRRRFFWLPFVCPLASFCNFATQLRARGKKRRGGEPILHGVKNKDGLRQNAKALVCSGEFAEGFETSYQSPLSSLTLEQCFSIICCHSPSRKKNKVHFRTSPACTVTLNLHCIGDTTCLGVKKKKIWICSTKKKLKNKQCWITPSLDCVQINFLQLYLGSLLKGNLQRSLLSCN